MERNVHLFRWFEFCRNLLFWQATWFLYLQNELSAAEAIALYAIYDISTTALEVPSGYMSDRLGRVMTLICSAVATLVGLTLLGLGNTFIVFAFAQACIGAGTAFVSGTNTALLYESLATEDRAAEMETHSLIAWRYSFSALAISAVIGGIFAVMWPPLPFFGSFVAFLGVLWITLQFREPPRDGETATEAERLRQLFHSFKEPLLIWLFVLGVLMYGYSHIPFVFGQPYIAEALQTADLSLDAPLVSGVVTALMMCVSLTVSMFAARLRTRIGLVWLLLIAFAMQSGLALGLALSGSVGAIALLLLRMVPDALSTPFIAARIQPLLGDETRATFMSVKSLFGRIVFATSLAIAASYTDAVGEMTKADLRLVLLAYAGVGFTWLAILTTAALALRLNRV